MAVWHNTESFGILQPPPGDEEVQYVFVELPPSLAPTMLAPGSKLNIAVRSFVMLCFYAKVWHQCPPC